MASKRHAKRSKTTRRPASAKSEAAVTEQVSPELPGESTGRDIPAPIIVGIGASAGSLDAFKKLFAAMPRDSGIAFVLIPHLDPTHERLIPELIARYTSIPVVEATEGMPVEADRVYVNPPNEDMAISGGVFRRIVPYRRSDNRIAGVVLTFDDITVQKQAREKLEKELEKRTSELATISEQLHQEIGGCPDLS